MPPVVVQGASETQGAYSAVEVRDLGYDSPMAQRLDPNKALHGEVLAKLMRQADESFRVMQDRHPTWAKLDQVMRAYIPLSTYEKNLKRRRSGNEGAMADENRPVSIMVPYSFATRDTLLTYLTEAFLSDTPFQYDGGGPEDTIGAKLMELAVDYQARSTDAALNIHTAFSDGLTYGIGPCTFDWVSKWGRKATMIQRPVFNGYGEIIGTEPARMNQDALLYEGNRIFNIDPYRYLPDPNVSAERVQDGEFVGWTRPLSYYRLLAMEKADPGMFNVKRLEDKENPGIYTGGSASRLVSSYANRINDAGSGTQGFKTQGTRYHEVLFHYAEIIPKEWKLGDLDEPQIWHFMVADDTTILKAQPIDMNHGQYPVSVAVPDFDGYSITPVSRMEIIQGLQVVLNWLFNSHIANVRKAINDMLIVDPSLVHMGDLENPEPGKMVRLRRSAWGRGVNDAVKQLVVNDVTRGNMADVPSMLDLMNRASAAVDSTQGIMRSGGERRSATEFRGTAGSALSRLERLARMLWHQFMKPNAYFMASHTQQYMSQNVYVKATGSWPEELAREYGKEGGVTISPFDLMVDFDIIPKDGTTPTSGAQNADVMQMMFSTIAPDPELRQTFDLPRIFTSWARQLGYKNAYDFVRRGGQVPAQVMPDQQVMNQVQAGNAVPLEQMGGLA